MKLETEKGKIELTEKEVSMVRGSNPAETRKGLVVDMDGKTHGEKKAVSLRERGDGVFVGQMYFRGPNRKCTVEMGELEDGESVSFLRVDFTAAKTVEKPPAPYVPPLPVAPRRLETLEDAQWYQEFFATPIPESATVFYHPTVPVFPARKRPISYYGVALGMGTQSACCVRYLMDLSAAMVAGDDESIAEIRGSKWRRRPQWPDAMPDPGTPEWDALEV